MSLIGNNWAGGTHSSRDPTGMGRWTEISDTGKQQHSLRILMVYRVPKTSITKAGPTTSYYHQWHFLRRSGHATPDPQAQLLQDLSEHI